MKISSYSIGLTMTILNLFEPLQIKGKKINKIWTKKGKLIRVNMAIIKKEC